MSWTDESGNPECECSHLWSNHYQKMEIYHCEAPDCDCSRFSEQSAMDEWADVITLMEEDVALNYDCERHGKGIGPDCPTCFDSDNKIRGRYVP